MTAERRVAKVESSLSPTALILRWLAEAHSFDALDAYAASELDAPPGDFPADRLARQAEEGARAASRGLPYRERDAAVRRAVINTLFRYHLVLRINVRAHEMIDRQWLVHYILVDRLGHRVERDQGRFATLELGYRDLIRQRCTDVRAMEMARISVEARFLDGATALFSAILRDWADLHERADELAAMDARLAELDGEEPMEPPDEPSEAELAKAIADLVEPARVTALEQVGEGGRAQALARRWVRPKLMPDVPPNLA